MWIASESKQSGRGPYVLTPGVACLRQFFRRGSKPQISDLNKGLTQAQQTGQGYRPAWSLAVLLQVFKCSSRLFSMLLAVFLGFILLGFYRGAWSAVTLPLFTAKGQADTEFPKSIARFLTMRRSRRCQSWKQPAQSLKLTARGHIGPSAASTVLAKTKVSLLHLRESRQSYVSLCSDCSKAAHILWLCPPKVVASAIWRSNRLGPERRLSLAR